MSKVLFQWVDGGILRQFQLEKNSDQYRILMAVVNEVKGSLEGNTDAAAQTAPASNEVVQQADSSSTPPTVSPLPARASLSSETPAAPPMQQAQSKPPTNVRTTDRKTAENRQWSFCDNCKANGGKNKYIYGTRFKCAVCKNFDLCEACEASGVHAHHVMLRIGVIVQHEVDWSSRALKPLHDELRKFCQKLTPAPPSPSGGKQDKNVCDECNVHLAGARLKCTVCDDFDLCSACDKKGVHDHHVMMRFSGPVQDVGAWKDLQGSSGLHAQLTAFHDRVIAVKSDVSNASVKAAKNTRSKKAPSKTPSRSRRPQGHKRAASLTAGAPALTLRKSPRVSYSPASGPCTPIKSSVSADPAQSRTEANQAAAASSPLIGPLKTETSEAVQNETAT